MDPSSTIQLIVIIVLLVFSAFFSSAETAFATANRIRIRSLADEGNKRALIVLKIIDNPSKMLSAILIGNNIVNIVASSLTTTLAIDLFGSVAAGIATGILTVLVLIFGEITPKTAATLNADKFALAYARIILFIMTIFTPIIFIVDKLASFVMLILGINRNQKTQTITENELRTIVEVSHEEGVIESGEHDMINNVFDFGDSQAKDVMIPRIDITFADINSSYEEIIELFKREKYTRIPIYENSIDNVVGVINVKDLLFYDPDNDFDLHNFLREVYFTYEFKNTSNLLNELRKTSNSIAIVIDEYGSTVGMITLEDLLEEIVGEIRDEYDEDEKDPIQKLSDTEYIVEGSAKIDDLDELLNISLKSDDYDSIAGFIIEHMDCFPSAGDSFVKDNVHFEIESVSKNRIDSIKIHILPANDTPETE